jgi:hypothetical protein
VKNGARWLLGDYLLGRLDYYVRFGESIGSWGGPFNGQRYRQELFTSLIKALQPFAIVETGTYRGTTTAYMAETTLSIFTVESNRRFFGFAEARLRNWNNITLMFGDSRKALAEIFSGPLKEFLDQTIFFYLDAHWHEDLPLLEEIKIILERNEVAVIMIDDFEVPHDAGYGFDNYGPNKALNALYIEPVVTSYDLHVYYPSTPSVNETGQRRGCVVLVKDASHNQMLSSLPLLKRMQ